MEPSAGTLRFVDGFPAPLPGRFAAALKSGPGLALAYRGEAAEVIAARLRVFTQSDGRDDAGHPTRRVVLVDPEADVHLHLTYTYFESDAAVLYGAEIENHGRAPLEGVSNPRFFDFGIDLVGTGIGNPTVHTIGGGVTHWFFPPKAYQLDEYRILGHIQEREPLRISSGDTGRSSDGQLPFFYIHSEAGDSGIFCGLEWSGLWAVDFTRDDLPTPIPWAVLGPHKTLHVKGWVPEVDLALAPGERLVLPRALIGFYAGPIDAGRNTLKRFLWRTWAPLWNGSKPTPPVVYNQHGAFGVHFTDGFMRTQVDVADELGIEYFEIDAGWYPGCPEVFSTGVGNWNREDLDRFPDGVRAFADYVRSKGMQYGSWFDIERAWRGTDVTVEHPDWCLWVEEELPEQRAGRDIALLDFSERIVQDWAIELINRRIRDWGVRWMRYDNNMGPRAYWASNDRPGQRGRLQFGHIRGVYRLLETLLRDNPELLLEGCSSGGRRIDLGTLARAHSFWMSDHNQNTHIVRTQHSGALTVLPGIYLNSRIVYRGHDYPDHFFHSHFGGALMISEDLASWSRKERATARRHLEIYKSIRHLLNADYYPLFEWPRDVRCWDGWQFDDPAAGEGFVLGFRMESPKETVTPVLRGLEPSSRYAMTDPYTGEEWTARGRELLEDGLIFSLPKNSSRLIRYVAV